MRVPSALLSIFRYHDATLSPEDADLDVPNQINVSLEIPEVITFGTFGAVGTETKRSSFYSTYQGNVANAALLDDIVCTVGPGLWDLTIIASYVSNNTNVAEYGEVYMTDLAGTAGGSIVRFWSIANVSRDFNTKIRLASQMTDGLLINIFLSSNGAGDSHSLDVNVIGNRLG